MEINHQHHQAHRKNNTYHSFKEAMKAVSNQNNEKPKNFADSDVVELMSKHKKNEKHETTQNSKPADNLTLNEKPEIVKQDIKANINTGSQKANEPSTDDALRQTAKLPDINKQAAPMDKTGQSEQSGDGKNITLTLINTNDMHAYLKNMAEVAGLVEQLKQKHPDALVIDCGDIAYNPPYSDKHHFKPMIDVMNHIGYDIVDLGNHEFQWGEDALVKEYVTKMNADVLSANVLDKNTNDYIPGVKPYVIKEINGIKVGVIGVVTPKMATQAHPSVGSDVKKLDIDETLKKLIPEVRGKGADIIVVLSHHGVHDDPKMAERVPGIDVILSAHDHQLTETPIVVSKYPSKTYIFEGASHGKYVGETTLEIDEKTKKIISAQMRPIPTSSNTVKPDQEVQDMIDKMPKERM